MMPFPKPVFCYLTSAFLLMHSMIHALHPLRAPSQTITKIDGTPHNGSAVPGESPFKYHNDPSNDLFKIGNLDMHSNPCVIEAYCTVLLRGEFTSSLTNTTPHVSFNVTSHLRNGRTGLLPGEDDFCNWVDIVQDVTENDAYTQNHAQGLAQDDAHQPYYNLFAESVSPTLHVQKRKNRKICPPKKGKAQISYTILLLGGWQPEANYTVKVKATEEGEKGKTIFDLLADFELKYKDGYIVK